MTTQHPKVQLLSTGDHGEQWAVGDWREGENPVMSFYTTIVFYREVDERRVADRSKAQGRRYGPNTMVGLWRCEKDGPFKPDNHHWCEHVRAVKETWVKV